MFYGWKLALLVSFGNFMLQGGVIYTMNIFLEPLCALHGWTRGELGITMGIGSFASNLSMIAFSRLAQQYALRTLMIAAGGLGSLAFCLLGQTDSLFLFTCLFSLAWLCGQGCGGVVGNVLMNNWFIQYRGRAFGLANIGISLSAAFLPLVTFALIQWVNISTAYILLGALSMSLVPLCFWLVRDTPQEMGLSPDNKDLLETLPPPVQEKLPLKELLRIPDAYIIGIVFGLALLVAAGIVSQMKPRFSSLGFSDDMTMLFVFFTGLGAAGGKLLWGWLCDRLTPLRATRLLLLTNSLTLIIGLLPATAFSTGFFAITYGLSAGGLWAVMPAIIAYHFRQSLFAAINMLVSFLGIIRAFGYPLMGYSFDLTGSYDAAFVIYLVLLIGAFLLTLRLRENNTSHNS